MNSPNVKKACKEPAQSTKVTVSWEIAEDDQEWHLAQRAAPTAVQQWGRRRWVAIAGALLFLLAAALWLWYQAEAGLSEIEGELQAAVEASQWQAPRESRMEATHSALLHDIEVGKQAPGPAHIEVRDVREEWAIVQVTTTPGDLSYRQTLLYRRGANGWYAAAPTAAVWGAPRTLETTYFIFHYFALDAKAVAEAAAKLDAFYPDLAASYPHEPASEAKKQVRINPEYSVEETFNIASDSAVEIASPALYLAPTDISEGDILAQAVLLGLLEVLVDHSRERLLPTGANNFQVMARLNAVLWSLRLWQLWSTELPLANLHKPTIQWLNSEEQVRLAAPAFAAKLCPLHQLWRAAPFAIQIPLFCGDPQHLQRYEVRRYYPIAPPRSLAAIHLFTTTMQDEPARGVSEAEWVGLATLCDYAATRYGRQSLSTLLANIVTHSSWETLIPATFGVSYRDFEVGWQAHLHSHYGVSASVIP